MKGKKVIGEKQNDQFEKIDRSEKIEDILDSLKIEIDEDFLPENFSENPQKVQKFKKKRVVYLLRNFGVNFV